MSLCNKELFSFDAHLTTPCQADMKEQLDNCELLLK
jgi:hypothetical protein